MRAKQTESTPNRSLDRTSTKQRSVLKNKQCVTFEAVERRKRRKNLAIRQIKYYQSTTTLLLRSLPFERLVKEIAESLTIPDAGNYRWRLSAIQILQVAAEAYAIALMEDTQRAAIHAKRVTIRPEDMRLVRIIRGRDNPQEMI